MKFGIGLESMMGYNTYLDVNNEPGVTGVEALVADNLFEIESGEYKATVESILVDVDIMLTKGNVYGLGTEADEDKKEEPKAEGEKKAWYKRLWDAIVKMFKTIGGWFTSAWNWIKKKFGFGGDNDVTEVAKEVAKGQVNALSRIEMFVESEEYQQSKNKDALKEEAKKLVEGELKKSKVLIRASGLIGKIADQLAEEVVGAVETNQTGKATINIAKVKITIFTFDSEILKRFDKFQASNKLSALESALESLSLTDNNDAFQLFIAAEKVLATVALCGEYMFEVLFGNIGNINSAIISRLTQSRSSINADYIENSKHLLKAAKDYDNKFKELVVNKPQIKFNTVNLNIRPNADGSLPKNNAIDDLLKKESNLDKSRNLTNFIVRLSEISSKSISKATTGLDKFSELAANDTKLSNNPEGVQNMKEILTIVKSIGNNTINVLREQTLAKLLEQQTVLRNVSDTRGVVR